jgi:hypothetical protein
LYTVAYDVPGLQAAQPYLTVQLLGQLQMICMFSPNGVLPQQRMVASRQPAAVAVHRLMRGMWLPDWKDFAQPVACLPEPVYIV